MKHKAHRVGLSLCERKDPRQSCEDLSCFYQVLTSRIINKTPWTSAIQQSSLQDGRKQHLCSILWGSIAKTATKLQVTYAIKQYIRPSFG